MQILDLGFGVWVSLLLIACLKGLGSCLSVTFCEVALSHEMRVPEPQTLPEALNPTINSPLNPQLCSNRISQKLSLQQILPLSISVSVQLEWSALAPAAYMRM